MRTLWLKIDNEFQNQATKQKFNTPCKMEDTKQPCNEQNQEIKRAAQCKVQAALPLPNGRSLRSTAGATALLLTDPKGWSILCHWAELPVKKKCLHFVKTSEPKFPVLHTFIFRQGWEGFHLEWTERFALQGNFFAFLRAHSDIHLRFRNGGCELIHVCTLLLKQLI